MITLDEGRRRVDTRLDRLLPVTHDEDRTAPIESVALLCSGTDVHGPELRRELARATTELVELLEAGVCDCRPEHPQLTCASPVLIAGVLTRTFWLGYAMGHADE
jgi:hypothetical protein